MTYPGGKGRLWRELVSLMPPHDVYIETHLGGGSILRNKRPASRNIGIDRDAAVIETAKAWALDELQLIHGRAEDFLTSYEFRGTELVYLDPPYLPDTKSNRRYYRYEYSEDDHRELLGIITDLNCPVMISGYDSELYREHLHDWRCRSLMNVTHGGKRIEQVWANFEFGADLHDFSVIGRDFRERDRIRRRTRRWTDRLDRLPALERSTLVEAMIMSPIVDPAFVDRLAERKRKASE